MMDDSAPSTTDTSAGRVLSKILGRIYDPHTIALLKGYASSAPILDDYEHRALATLEAPPSPALALRRSIRSGRFAA